MTALPLPRPRLLTAAEFAALDEAVDGRYELQDGNVVMSPSPVPLHQACQGELQGGLLRAADAVLVVEILSPGSVRTDRVIKRGEYADAGIRHHWMVDLDDGPSLTACHLAGESGYQDAPPERGELVTGTPFPLRIDVAALLDRP